MIFRRLWILIFLMIMIILSCSDPLSTGGEIIKILVEGPLPSGQYSIFWDGTDEKQNLTEAGTYIALLYTQDFTLVDTLTALPGTKKKYNRNDYYFDTPQLMDEMQNNDPDPFYIEDGTNIRFLLSHGISVRLTIQKPKE